MVWAGIGVGWALIALSFTLNYFLFADHYVAIFKVAPTLSQMLVWEIPYWALWVAIWPLIIRLARRFPLGSRDWMRNAAIHLVCCLLLALLHRLVYLFICWILNVVAYQRYTSLPELYSADIFFNLPTGFMSYGTILLVSNAFDYFDRYRAEELKALQLETQLVQAQLEALKMQLHPHFLFNTLNSISALQMTDVAAANRMISRLGDFLRMTLANVGAQEISLRQEMEFLNCYLEIERIRFQDRLSVEIEVTPELWDAPVPNLILQPIVENAIRHGVAATVHPMRIAIRAQRENGSLCVEVQDDGPGLQSRPVREGVGLANTRARLQQLYGEKQKLELANAPEGGLVVRMEIPVRG